MIVLTTPNQEIVYYTFVISMSLLGTLSPIYTNNFSNTIAIFTSLMYFNTEVKTRRQLARDIYKHGILDKTIVTEDIIDDVKKFTEEEFDSRIIYQQERIQRLENEKLNVDNELKKTKKLIEYLSEHKESNLKLFEKTEETEEKSGNETDTSEDYHENETKTSEETSSWSVFHSAK